MKVTLNCVGYIDRRSPALLAAARALEQARADQAIERLWRARVAKNEARRWMQKQHLALFQTQAD